MTTVNSFQILSTSYFGQNNRYQLSECQTRFGNKKYFVFDTTKIDRSTNLPVCIRQNPLKAIATETLEKGGLAVGDKVLNFGSKVIVIGILPEAETYPIQVEDLVTKEKWVTKISDCLPL